MSPIKKHYWHAMLREAARISKDHTLILSLLLAPVFYAFFYGSIYMYKTEKEVGLAIIDLDHSSLSNTFLKMVDQNEKVRTIRFHHKSEALKSYHQGDVQGILIIPSSFEKKVKRLQASPVELILNNSRFLPSNDINETVSKTALIVGAGIRLKYFEKHGNDTEMSKYKAMPISLRDHSMFLSPITYGGFLLPGLLLLILQQTFLIGLAESIAREREQKTIHAWFKLSQFKIIPGLIGKGVFYFLLFISYTFFFHIINFKLLDLNINGNVILLYITIPLFFMVLLFFGSFIASFFTKELWALQFFAFTSYPFFLLAGYSWPTTSMPFLLQIVANLIPTTPMLEIYSGIIFKNSTIIDITPAIIHLALLGVIYGLLAYYRFNKLVSKSLREKV